MMPTHRFWTSSTKIQGPIFRRNCGDVRVRSTPLADIDGCAAHALSSTTLMRREVTTAQVPLFLSGNSDFLASLRD